MSDLLREIIISVILLAGVVILSHIIGFLWRNVFKKIALKTPTKLDIILFETTEKPIFYLILVGGFYLVIRRFEEYVQIGKTIGAKIIDGVFFTSAVIVVIYFIYAVIKSIIDWYLTEIATKTKTDLDDEFLPLFRRISKIILLFLGALVILSHFNVNITGLLATAGVASLAIALAAQETIANMISGFIIMVDRPFRVEDRVELADGIMGDVQEIGLRSTKILSFDHTLIVVPNSEIAKARVINYSYPNPKIKIRQVISVAYGTNLDKVKDVILDICKSHTEVLKDPSPEVFFTEFGESSLNLLMICWVSDYKDKFRINDKLNMEIKRRFEKENIEIPFPQRDIHIKK